MSSIAIEFKDVTKQFNNASSNAVDHVSFSVNEGEMITILGTSGCGKTTLMKMVNRLYEIALTAAVNDGLRILDLRLKNRSYTIVPTCSMVKQLANQLQFDEEKESMIRLSVEEMLTDRISNAFEENGEIRMEVLLMPQWMRLRFTDTGRKDLLESEDASISAKIILANVDSYSTGESEAGETEYCLDYLYNDDFNVKDYLMRYKEIK